MTPKERIKAAMELKSVDKIPLMCQMSIGHMLVQLDVSPLEFWFDKNTYADSLIKLRDIYDFDGILVSLYGHKNNWQESISDISMEDENKIVKMNNGDQIIFPHNDLPHYNFASPREEKSIDEISLSDLPEDLDYFPVSNDLPFFIDQTDKFGVLKDLVSKVDDNYSIHGEITSPFDYLLDYLGHQNALLSLLDNPQKCKMILKHFTDLLVDFSKEMCDTGIDAIKISSPFAGAGFISPDDYREFVLPYEKRIVQTINSKNVHSYIHTCGSIDDRLELMFDSGTSGIECLDPPPLGNVELEDAVSRIGNRGFIKGNIDSVHCLLNGDEKGICEDVLNRIKTGSTTPGFILSTACSIAPNVKRENIQLLRRIVDEWNIKKS